MKPIENPIMEYLQAILEHSEQLVEDVSDLRYRIAKLEKIIMEKKSTPENISSKGNERPVKLNAVLDDLNRIKRRAKALGISDQSFLLRVKLLDRSLEQLHGEAEIKLWMAEAQLLGLID